MSTEMDDKLPLATPQGDKKLKVLIYNCGMLRLKLFGISMFTVFENPPYVSERFPHLAKALLESGADVLLLQEVYETKHVLALVESLQEIYPYSNQRNTTFMINFTNGLLMFSKYPIVDAKVVVHKESARLEYVMGSKSMQVAVIESPLGLMQLINMHTTAGGDMDPENPKVDSIRESELVEAITESKAFATKHKGMSIILGDLNMGPGSSPGNYDFMLGSGYKDGIKESILGVVPREEVLDFETWDPKNVLNAGGVHAHCAKDRIDHVFLLEDAPLQVEDVNRFMKEPYIPIRERKSGKDILCTH
jgi:endonuclease/exonuclease/phosphatase family metal-dependent hydrolase